MTGQESRALELDDLFALTSVSSPRVSPDGQWVAYTVSTTAAEEGERVARLWMVSMTDGDPLPMTLEGESVSSPAWSPDGRWLSFLASRDSGKTQVWGLDRRGGEAQQLTDVEQGEARVDREGTLERLGQSQESGAKGTEIR